MGSNGSAVVYYSSRPIVAIEGRDETELGDELLSLLVEETIDGLFRCEAKFSNRGLKDGQMDFLYLDRALLDFGAELAVTLGPPGKSRRVFKGKVLGMDASFPAARPPEISVLAEDAFQDLRMTRRTRMFEQSSDADVARQIAQDHGLSPQVDHNGPTFALLAQVNQSDLAFLRDRALAGDAVVRVEDGALHFKGRGSVDEGTIDMTYGTELRELSVLADLAHQRTAVRVTGWDVSAQEKIESEAGDSAISSELGGLTGGGSILQQKFGDRVEQAVHLVPFSEAEATGLAESRYRELARRFVTGVAHADGDARVRVGSTVKFKGVGPMFDGKYAVTNVRHSFDRKRGYRTTFQVQRGGIGQ